MSHFTDFYCCKIEYFNNAREKSACLAANEKHYHAPPLQAAHSSSSPSLENREQWEDLPYVPEQLQDVLGEMGAHLLGKQNYTYLGLMGENKGEVEIGLDQYEKNPPWSALVNPFWGVIYDTTKGTIFFTEEKFQVIQANMLDRMDGRRMRKCLAYFIKQESYFKVLPVERYVDTLQEEIASEVVLWEELEACLVDPVFRGSWEENIAKHLLMWRAREVCWRFHKMKELQSSLKPGDIFLGSDITLWSILTMKICDN